MPSQRYLTEGVRRSHLLLAPVGVVFGIVAEWAAFGWSDPLRWIPDLAVGWTFFGCGLVAWSRRPGNLCGPLMVATGSTWFLANFSGVDNPAVAWVAANALFFHRGPLIHLLFAYPTGHLAGRLERAVVVGAYATGLVPALWNDVSTIVLGALLLVVTAAGFLRSVGRTRRARAFGVQATAALSLVLIGGAVARVLGGAAAARPALFAYEIVLVVIGAGLFSGLLLAPWERADVVDLVVELGEARSGSLRGELSRALGDPSLEIGYWVPDADHYVDAEGRVLALPKDDPHRSVTIVRREAEPIAAIVHDPSVLDDPALVQAVSSATQLAAANVELQAELRHRVNELTASRQRILNAGDEERHRLERRLEEGAERRLQGVARNLEGGIASASAEGTRDRIAQVRAQLDHTLDDIHGIALGLHPRALSERGLAEALSVLVDDLPMVATLDVTRTSLPPRVATVAYFVCSEALANIAKHADASTVRVSATLEAEVLRVIVEDDGSGGADPSAGSGLRGLADRVETIGGTFRVRSAPGRGTRLTAEMPLGGEEG